MRSDYYEDALSGTCGVSVVDSFGEYHYNKFQGGAGWKCAGFIPTKTCKEFYNEFKKEWKIVFQTEVRINKNSGNPFIFVVYDSTIKSRNIGKKFPWANKELED